MVYIIHRHPLVVRRSHPHERVSNFNFAIAWLERDKKSLIAVIARNYRAKVIDVFHEIGKQASRSSPLSDARKSVFWEIKACIV
uniref:Uncharacterized protein n=1 Tax=Manihot esculenta TaxID=3983 RepID=A0A2C9UKH2_MANES